MKAQALNSRLKEKDAYDIYYCLTNFRMGWMHWLRRSEHFLIILDT